MTAPPVPGVHTIILDPRLFIPGAPLFHVPEGYAITGATPVRWTRGGHVEFRVVVVRADATVPSPAGHDGA